MHFEFLDVRRNRFTRFFLVLFPRISIFKDLFISDNEFRGIIPDFWSKLPKL